LFSEKGFENTPISAVCEATNVSKGWFVKGNIYQYLQDNR